MKRANTMYMGKPLVSFDWAIKKILRNKANFEILEGFLSELIAPNKNLKIIRLLESESNKNSKEDKCNRVDILVELDSNDLVLIEVQVNRQYDFIHRTLYSTSKAIIEYLNEGENYSKIKKVYSVNILYFDLGQGKDYIYHGATNFVGMHLHDNLQLDSRYQELYNKKLVSEIFPEYFFIKVNNFDDLAKDTLDEWIYFLKNSDIKPHFHAKGLKKAKEKLSVLELTDIERQIYSRYQDDLHYAASMYHSSYDVGKLDGKKEGRKKGKEEVIQVIAKNMLSNNASLKDIAKITGLTIADIQQIIKQ